MVFAYHCLDHKYYVNTDAIYRIIFWHFLSTEITYLNTKDWKQYQLWWTQTGKEITAFQNLDKSQ